MPSKNLRTDDQAAAPDLDVAMIQTLIIVLVFVGIALIGIALWR
jgi:hypothetical protein